MSDTCNTVNETIDSVAQIIRIETLHDQVTALQQQNDHLIYIFGIATILWVIVVYIVTNRMEKSDDIQ